MKPDETVEETEEPEDESNVSAFVHELLQHPEVQRNMLTPEQANAELNRTVRYG